jgi:hypothetical protein
MTPEQIRQLMRNGDYIMADKESTLLRDNAPHDHSVKELQRQVHEYMQDKMQPGPKYTEWLEWFHDTLKPTAYVEIGVESGQSLQYAKQPTKSVGIDPAPKIVHGHVGWAKIFAMRSDDFFLSRDLIKELDGNKVDFSFIDGLHYYDQALADFMNVERYSHKNTVVLLHDAYPVISSTATREWNTTYWAGDTWKMVPILEKYRPDLNIITIPTFPTGLIAITNLDPDSTVLSTVFDQAVEEMANADYNKYYNNPVNLVVNNHETVKQWLNK